jgi:hypothetical protein
MEENKKLHNINRECINKSSCKLAQIGKCHCGKDKTITKQAKLREQPIDQAFECAPDKCWDCTNILC